MSGRLDTLGWTEGCGVHSCLGVGPEVDLEITDRLVGQLIRDRCVGVIQVSHSTDARIVLQDWMFGEHRLDVVAVVGSDHLDFIHADFVISS